MFAWCAWSNFASTDKEGSIIGVTQWTYVSKTILIAATFCIDLSTVAIIAFSGASNTFNGMVNNNCYTRDGERDITELASNFEYVLWIGLGEALFNTAALVSGCIARSYEIAQEKEIGKFAFGSHIFCVLIDIALSIINFAVFVVPAFNAYKKQDDLESRCYSFIYGNGTNENSSDYLSSAETAAIGFGSIAACGCLCGFLNLFKRSEAICIMSTNMLVIGLAGLLYMIVAVVWLYPLLEDVEWVS